MEEEGEEKRGRREGETEEEVKEQCAKRKGLHSRDRDAPACYINSLGDKKTCYFWFLKPSVR